MHGRRFISVFGRLWLAVMASTALSCNKNVIDTDNLPDVPNFNITSEVTVEFNILNPDASAKTKVDGFWS